VARDHEYVRMRAVRYEQLRLRRDDRVGGANDVPRPPRLPRRGGADEGGVKVLIAGGA